MATSQAIELSEQPLAVKMLYNSGSMWPSVVVHGHWFVSQRMTRNGGLRVERTHCHGIFGLSDYHQERPTYSQRKNNPRQLHPTPKSSCAQNMVVLK